MLSETALARHFAHLGARFRINHSPPRRAVPWTLDVTHDTKGSTFELRATDTALADLDVIVSNVDRATRHLLLLVREGTGARPHRYLCGHDERDWFLATVPGGVTTVAQAIEALKPEAVRRAQNAGHLKGKHRNRRHNPAFLRQGEWFFIPAPALVANDREIHRWEPIRRGGGKAHLVEEVVRLGGRVVYFRGREIMSAEEFDAHRNTLSRWEASRWLSGVVDAHVYGRGLVCHPDHATIVLNGWHEILANTEVEASPEAQLRLTFVD